MSNQRPTRQELERRVEELTRKTEELQDRLLEYERRLMQYVKHERLRPAKKQALSEGAPLFDGIDTEGIKHDCAEENKGEEEEEDRRRKQKKKRRGRKRLPEHLPRVEKEYPFDPARDLEDYDPEKGYTILSYDTSEELHIEPAKPYVVVHKRPVVAYTKRNGDAVVGTVGDPRKVFQKCMASPGILAKLATDRYHYHVTLYRIERWFKDHNCPLARSTLCIWLMRLGELLRPIREAQKHKIINGFKVHADDTNFPILRPGAGGAEDIRIWALIGAEERKEIIFKYTQRRTSKETFEVLDDVRGYLQVDACKTYDRLFDGRRIEVGCWSHVIRKFKDVASIDKRARPMLRMIRALYNVEETAADMELDHEAKYYFRRLASAPILSKIKKWVKEQREAEILESSFKKALNYVNNHWTALNTFLDDGRLSLDNNCCENEFHVIGIARRNSLFFGSEQGLDAGLVLMGLIRSCFTHGINPREYLEDVIRRMRDGTHPPEELTPAAWKQCIRSETIASATRAAPSQ